MWVEKTDFEHFSHCCTESMVDESIVVMTSVFYESEDGGIVCSQRQNSFHEVAE